MRTTLLEAPIPTGRRNPARARAQRAEIAHALRTLGLSASVTGDRLRIYVDRSSLFLTDKKVELVRSIVTDLLGLEISKESMNA